ncbi:MAG TPA: 3-hydroxyisobutyrate dehydrogenase [Sphingomicrobium sp.]|nr:3-hydroxyisobutyrate dehydrogenase [Sphingomicrobium sp.]
MEKGRWMPDQVRHDDWESEMARVAFIGLGHMGGGMAPNLAKAGHEVRAFDLSEAALSQAVEKGCKRAKSTDEAVKNADAVVTMLPAGKHVAEVYRSHVFGKAPKSAILMDCSTIDVATAKAVEAEAQEQGYTLVDAPVSGGIAAAEGGTLTFMVGGGQEGFEKAREYLEKMGKAVIHAGDAGSGQVAKICNNMLLGATMAATCEAFVLAQKLGLDPQVFFEISSKASGQSWSMTSYCPMPGVGPETPADRDYEGGFAAALMLKDLKLAMEAAQASGAYTPMGGEAEELYQRFVDLGGGGKDFSALIKMIDDSWCSPEGKKEVAPPVTTLE